MDLILPLNGPSAKRCLCRPSTFRTLLGSLRTLARFYRDGSNFGRPRPPPPPPPGLRAEGCGLPRYPHRQLLADRGATLLRGLQCYHGVFLFCLFVCLSACSLVCLFVCLFVWCDIVSPFWLEIESAVSVLFPQCHLGILLQTRCLRIGCGLNPHRVQDLQLAMCAPDPGTSFGTPAPLLSFLGEGGHFTSLPPCLSPLPCPLVAKVDLLSARLGPPDEVFSRSSLMTQSTPSAVNVTDLDESAKASEPKRVSQLGLVVGWLVGWLVG